MCFLCIDDLKWHICSVHKCDLTKDGGLKPCEPRPGEAMHPSTLTHAGSFLDTQAPKGMVVVASTSVNPRALGPCASLIVILPSVIPLPNWRPNSGRGGGGILSPRLSCGRGRGGGKGRGGQRLGGRGPRGEEGAVWGGGDVEVGLWSIHQ